MTANKQWIRRAGLLTAGMLIAVTGFNLLVDPYDIYRLVIVPGFNQNKPAAPRHVRLTKPALLLRYRFQALVTGSSRAEIGIDPGHPGWDPRYRPVFNFGLGGAGIEEIAQRLEGILQEQTVGQLVVGLDFFMFNALLGNPLATELEDAPSRRPIAGGDPKQWLSTLATTDAVLVSLETVRKQDRIRDPGYLPDGQIDTTFNVHRVGRFGHRKNFQRIERKYLAEDFFPSPHRLYRFVHPETGASTYEAFRRILELARARGVDLRLYISPCHARMLEVIDQAGLWPRYESWKRELTALVAAEAAAGAGRKPFPLWDFSGYNSVTIEAVPETGDRQTTMRYYWEGSHFKSETGDLVLDRLFAWHQPGREVPEDFGLLLTVANIEAHLAETRRQQANYRRHHPQDVKEIESLRREFAFLGRPEAMAPEL